MTSLITEWNRKLRYQPYTSWSDTYLEQLKQSVKEDSWRLNYHVQPESGLLNDPNGFSFFNNEWHLFYQFYPYGPVHGLKSWYHLTSTNLVDWQEKGIALEGDSIFDSHGVYSGSALAVDDKLFLAYSGNVRNDDWDRSSFQMGALMDNNGAIEKIKTPLISFPIEGYTDHVRDPQLIRYQDRYLIVLGAQNNDEQGEVLIYQSFDLKDWQLLGPLNFTDLDMGFMVECPTLLFIEEQPVLIFCPQGLDRGTIPYENIYPNMYVIGDSLDLATLSFKNPSMPKNLDEGFDVYATQGFTDETDRSLSIGWAGLPEIDYPTFKKGWAHCLSLVKELTITNGELYQFPVAEMKELREDSQLIRGNLNPVTSLIQETIKNSYELNLTFEQRTSGTLNLLANSSGTKAFNIEFDTKKGMLSVDRSLSGEDYAEADNLTRSITIEPDAKLELDIFVDESIIEIFINKGQQVITSRVFPNTDQTNITIKGHDGVYFGTMYSLRKMK